MATKIAQTAAEFIAGWNPPFDLIVPVPPSRKRSGYQPVVEIAAAIAERLSKPIVTDAVKKIKDTAELKNVFDYEQRLNLLQDAFDAEVDAVRAKRILLVDDLYRSGATAAVVTQQLLRAGAEAVYMLEIGRASCRERV